MSLTSYRAAPPRVIRVLRSKILSEFCEAKSRLSFASQNLAEFCKANLVCFGSVWRSKGRLSAAGVSAECIREDDRFVYPAFCRPGSDLLSRVLRRSTIGAGAFHGRVRNGNGCSHPARTTRSAKRKIEPALQARTDFEKLVKFFTSFEHVFCLSPRP